jgi:hypothetical protein
MRCFKALGQYYLSDCVDNFYLADRRGGSNVDDTVSRVWIDGELIGSVYIFYAGGVVGYFPDLIVAPIGDV